MCGRKGIKFPRFSIKNSQDFQLYLLPPHHLIHNPHITLNNLHDLRADILIDIIRYWDAVGAVAAEFHCGVHRLEQALGVNAGDDEVSLVYGLGTLSAGADADGRERMSYRGEEGRFLRESAAVADYCEGIHLQTVIVMESERLVLDDAWVQLEARSGETVTAARMAGIKDRHIILLSHGVDGVEQTHEVLLGVDVFLAVGAEQDVLSFL